MTHDLTTDKDRTAVLGIMKKLSIKCPPTFEMVEEKILNGPAFNRQVDEEVIER